MKEPAEALATGPLVSVIIAAYNTAQYVGEAIESALAQTYSPVEVIVVDDGSTDNTRDVLAAYGDRIIMLQQKNSGAAAARNTGLKAAHGEFMAVLDSDDVWTPDKLKRQMKLIEHCPELDLVFTKGRVMDHEGKDLSIVLPDSIPETLPLRQIMEGAYMLDGEWFAVLADVNFIPHMSVLARISTVRSVGGYDPELRCTEDYHLYCRLAAGGAHFGFVDYAGFRARRRSGRLTNDWSSHRENRKIALKKLLNGPWEFSSAVRRGLRRSLAALPKKAGDHAFCKGDRKLARTLYLEAFRYWPRPAQLASYLATFLGPLAPRALAQINRGSDAFDELLRKPPRDQNAT